MKQRAPVFPWHCKCKIWTSEMVRVHNNEVTSVCPQCGAKPEPGLPSMAKMGKERNEQRWWDNQR